MKTLPLNQHLSLSDTHDLHCTDMALCRVLYVQASGAGTGMGQRQASVSLVGGVVAAVSAADKTREALDVFSSKTATDLADSTQEAAFLGSERYRLEALRQRQTQCLTALVAALDGDLMVSSTAAMDSVRKLYPDVPLPLEDPDAQEAGHSAVSEGVTQESHGSDAAAARPELRTQSWTRNVQRTSKGLSNRSGVSKLFSVYEKLSGDAVALASSEPLQMKEICDFFLDTIEAPDDESTDRADSAKALLDTLFIRANISHIKKELASLIGKSAEYFDSEASAEVSEQAS